MWFIRWLAGLCRELFFRLEFSESFVRGTFKNYYLTRKSYK